ncbi:hypothetical protein [Paenibacillus glycinis]|uniref:Uncharacterized protein n=1 Tax=Paenibacillus glycinis TaxID=2697035 RepID=A0ABW9XTZ3_9BACL|nr:hypothetical protein [Paenibacillus glycinis]NBD25814.1 hypothetical protein [Paenibacillus glycinis]
MMIPTYVAEQLWRHREAEWDRRQRRGDFIAPDKPGKKAADGRSKKKRQPIPKDRLPASYND